MRGQQILGGVTHVFERNGDKLCARGKR